MMPISEAARTTVRRARELLGELREALEDRSVSPANTSALMVAADRYAGEVRALATSTEPRNLREGARALRKDQAELWLDHSAWFSHTMPSTEAMGWILKAMRTRAGLSQVSLAERIEVSASFVAAVESEADSRTPSQGVLVSWANACGYHVGMLFTPMNGPGWLGEEQGPPHIHAPKQAPPTVQTVADALNYLIKYGCVTANTNEPFEASFQDLDHSTQGLPSEGASQRGSRSPKDDTP